MGFSENDLKQLKTPVGCPHCGTELNAHLPPRGRAEGPKPLVPKTTDIGMCGSCGKLFEFYQGRTRVFTDATYNKLPSDIKQIIDETRRMYLNADGSPIDLPRRRSVWDED